MSEKDLFNTGLNDNLKPTRFIDKGREKSVFKTNYDGILLAKFKKQSFSFIDQLKKIREFKGTFPQTIPFSNLKTKKMFALVEDYGETFESYVNKNGFPDIKINELSNLIINFLNLSTNELYLSDLYASNVCYNSVDGFKIIDFDYSIYDEKNPFSLYELFDYILKWELFYISKENTDIVIENSKNNILVIEKILKAFKDDKEICFVFTKNYSEITEADKESLKIFLAQII
jgi:hypothetical protein